MYAAEAHDVNTCPMEGFDDTRVRRALDIPDRYSVPVVIAAGYAASIDDATPRLPYDQVFFKERFGQTE